MTEDSSLKSSYLSLPGSEFAHASHLVLIAQHRGIIFLLILASLNIAALAYSLFHWLTVGNDNLQPDGEE